MSHTHRLLAAALGLCLAHAPGYTQTPAPTPAPDDTLVLVHRFDLPVPASGGPVAIKLLPGHWRVGEREGPVATDAQLRQALSNLVALEIGGRCAGWRSGRTSYPCGFGIRELDFGAAVKQHFSGLAADWHQVARAAEFADATDDGPNSGTPARANEPAEHAVRTTAAWVAVVAPLQYLGDKSVAYGRSMQFSLRAISNTLRPSSFERASGTVVLRSGPQPMAPRPPGKLNGNGLRAELSAPTPGAETGVSS